MSWAFNEGTLPAHQCHPAPLSGRFNGSQQQAVSEPVGGGLYVSLQENRRFFPRTGGSDQVSFSQGPQRILDRRPAHAYGIGNLRRRRRRGPAIIGYAPQGVVHRLRVVRLRHQPPADLSCGYGGEFLEQGRLAGKLRRLPRRGFRRLGIPLLLRLVVLVPARTGVVPIACGPRGRHHLLLPPHRLNHRVLSAGELRMQATAGIQPGSDVHGPVFRDAVPVDVHLSAPPRVGEDCMIARAY